MMTHLIFTDIMMLIYITIIIIVILLLFLIVKYYYNTGYDIILIHNKKDLEKYHEKIKIFEKKMSHWYPLNSTDTFRIDHGPNYYKFFNRMGKLYINLVLNSKQQIVGTMILILRKINNEKIWYVCDLKVHPKHRNNHLTFKMLLKSYQLKKITDKFYAVSMNNENKTNKIVKLSKKISSIMDQNKSISSIMDHNINFNTLKIYMIDKMEIQKVKDILEKYIGEICFINLIGKKNLILKSTNKPLDLYHINFTKKNKIVNSNEITTNIPDNSKIMFCLEKNNNVNKILKINNITTNITASIIYHGFKSTDKNFGDFLFIQTSEI